MSHHPSAGAEPTDAELIDKLRRNSNLLHAEQCRARAAFDAACAACAAGPLATVQDHWRAVQAATRQSAAPMRNTSLGGPARIASDVAQLRIASEAADLFAALAVFTPDQVRVLKMPHANTLANAPEARKLLQSKPATARWLERLDADAARADARIAAAQEAQREHAPTNLVRSMRARGMTIELGKSGKIEVGGAVSRALPTELDGLREWRGEVLAFLKGEQPPEVQSPVLVI